MLNLVNNTWVADGSIASIRKRHGYNTKPEECTKAPPASEPALIYAAMYEADRVLELLLTKFFGFSLKSLTGLQQAPSRPNPMARATLVEDPQRMVQIETEPCNESYDEEVGADSILETEIAVAEDVEGFVANQQVDFHASVERDRRIDENLGNDIRLPARLVAHPANVSTESPTRSSFLTELEAAITSADNKQIFLDSLVEMREKSDRSKHMRFNRPSAVIPEAEMARRARKTTLDAGNGNQMEVGTLLRERRTKQAGAQLVAKKASRRALWMQKVDALVGELGQDPSREGLSTCCVFALPMYLPPE